jgi:hypothetical protein
MNPKQDMVLLLMLLQIMNTQTMMLLQLKLLYLPMLPKKLLKRSLQVDMEHQKLKHHRTNMMLPVKAVTSVVILNVKDAISVVILVVTEEETRIIAIIDVQQVSSVEDVKEEISVDKFVPNCLKAFN